MENTTIAVASFYRSEARKQERRYEALAGRTGEASSIEIIVRSSQRFQ
jgi:hypothetical protein